MENMSFNQYLAFVAGCTVGAVEVTGIKNPVSESKYDDLELSQQQQLFVRDAGGDYNVARPIQVTVQDLLGGSSAGDESGYVTPDEAIEFITARRLSRATVATMPVLPAPTSSAPTSPHEAGATFK